MSNGNGGSRSDAGGERRGRRRTAAEWTIFALAALLILAVVGLLLADWVAGSSKPPVFETTVEDVRRRADGYHVSVEVENVGDQAAAGVHLGAELEVGGEVLDAEETIDFLPPGGDARATFVFGRDPRQGRFSVSVVAFREP